MRIRLIHIIIILILLSICACLDPFKFDIDSAQPGIVIDGVFDNSVGPHIVKISSVTPFGYRVFEGIPNAEVVIISEDIRYPLIEKDVGIYELPKNKLQGIPGNIYQLDIQLSDGTEIISNLETMPPGYALDEAQATFGRDFVLQESGRERNQHIITVTASTVLPETEEAIFLKYTMDETYSFPEVYCGGLHMPKICYITQPSNSQDFEIFNSNLITSREIKDLKIAVKTRIVPEEYSGRHYFTVYQHSITKEAYRYWERVKELLTQEGTVFDKPPARVPGNLISTNSELEILGYFQVASVSIARKFLQRNDYTAATTLQPACSQFVPRISACCNCFEIKNSTGVRPNWF